MVSIERKDQHGFANDDTASCLNGYYFDFAKFPHPRQLTHRGLATPPTAFSRRLYNPAIMKTLFAFLLLLAAISLSAQTEFLKPSGLAPAHGYSHAVVTKPGKLIFLSGQVANDPSGQLVGKGDLKVQTEQVFANLNAALAAAGATFNDVVKITWYIKGYKPEDLPVLRGVRDKYVNTAQPPASTLIGVASLFQEGYLLEVDAIAVLPEKSSKAK